MSKYYTPDISEFHVGFEFEGYNISGYNNKDKWLPFILDLGLGEQWSRIEDYINNNQIRVKYLDREDIEELGFKRVNSTFDSRDLEFENNTHRIIKSKQTGKIVIQELPKKGWIFEFPIIVFGGTIRNKSELKILLKQLGIC